MVATSDVGQKTQHRLMKIEVYYDLEMRHPIAANISGNKEMPSDFLLLTSGIKIYLFLVNY
jgi:hypothetical protein